MKIRIYKITLELNCKLTTPEVTLKTTSQLHSKVIMAHIPKFNITSVISPRD